MFKNDLIRPYVVLQIFLAHVLLYIININSKQYFFEKIDTQHIKAQ